MKKYLLIDGNNLAIRSAFANSELKDGNGNSTGAHYGFFKGLISLKRRFKDYLFAIVWDGSSKRRKELSLENVEKRIIKSAYKANREENKKSENFIEFFKQLPDLQKGISHTGIQQICFPEYEADDVISSYSKLLRNDNELVLVTTDKDYYQMLHKNVSVWNGFNLKMITLDGFQKEYKITPEQFVDFGALMGDAGDNIFGIPSWGDKTALEEIQKHGSYQKVLEYYYNQYKELDNKFPPIESMLDLESLKLQTTKSGKTKYSDVYYGMPFSGVALAIEWGKIKAIPQKALTLLMYQERLDVAYSLKKVDDDIANLEEIKLPEPKVDLLQEYFKKHSIKSLLNDVSVFSKIQNEEVKKEYKDNFDIEQHNVKDVKMPLFDF